MREVESYTLIGAQKVQKRAMHTVHAARSARHRTQAQRAQSTEKSDDIAHSTRCEIDSKLQGDSNN